MPAHTPRNEIRAALRPPVGSLFIGGLLIKVLVEYVSSGRLPATSSAEARRATVAADRAPGARDEAGALPLVLTDARGLELYIRHWPTHDGEPKGAVLLLHGFAWHSGGFAPLAALLNRAGYCVASFDLPAHGRSGSTHGLRGYDPDPLAWVDDAALVLSHMQQHLAPEGAPCFIYAESISGALMLHLLSREGGGGGVAGAALVGAPGGLAPAEVGLPAPVAAAALWLARRLPAAPVPVPRQLWRRAFAAQFSDKGKGEAAFDSDRFAVTKPVWGAGTFLDVILPLFEDGADSHLASITTPILVLQGGRDVCFPPPNAGRLVARLAASPSARAEVLDGMGHWLSQEPEARLQEVADEVLRWMDGVARAGAAQR